MDRQDTEMRDAAEMLEELRGQDGVGMGMGGFEQGYQSVHFRHRGCQRYVHLDAFIVSEVPTVVKRRIFISFDHNDTLQVSGFMGLRQILDNFDFYNHKLDRRILSRDEAYVCRVIREEYIKPASVTVVLIGEQTAESSWVQWEIEESKRQGKGLLAVHLKGIEGAVPAGLLANAVGGWEPDKFASWIEWAYQHRSNS